RVGGVRSRAVRDYLRVLRCPFRYSRLLLRGSRARDGRGQTSRKFLTGAAQPRLCRAHLDTVETRQLGYRVAEHVVQDQRIGQLRLHARQYALETPDFRARFELSLR